MTKLTEYIERKVYVAQTTGKDKVEFLGEATIERAADRYRLRFDERELLISQADVEGIVSEQLPIRIILKEQK